jgi:hypothetical protein
VDVLTMAQVRWKLLASERFRTAVLLVCAGTATFLALIGIFGLVSYTVAQRHREIGLRVALGATYSRLVWLMLRQALVPAVLGLVAGTFGALAVSHCWLRFSSECRRPILPPSAPPSACSSARPSSPRSSRLFEASASIRPSPCAMSSALASRLLHSDSG